MYPTTELRWFSPGLLPLSIIKWYELSAPSAESQDPRTDHYLNLVGGEKMSIKVREGRLEVKKRYPNVEIVNLHPRVRGHLENWRKWGIDLGNVERLPPLVPTDTWIPVTKHRRLCTFQNLSGRWRPVSIDLAPFHSGCEMELTTLKVGTQVWWTLAIEAFGPANGNRPALLSLSSQIFASLDPPHLSTPDSYGYLGWLDQLS